MSTRRAVVLTVAATLLAACVVETEPAPRRPLLRDVMAAAHAQKPNAPIEAGAPVMDAAMPAIGKDAGESPAVALPIPPPIPDAYRSCQTNADCVAILPNGCCHDGRNEALNKGSVDGYRASFTCPSPVPRCPMHLVLDRREPVCDAVTHACKLVEPETAPQ